MTLSYVFSCVFHRCSEDKQTIGALSIFSAWMALVLFIRKFPRLGIYVVMFTSIMYTFTKFFLIFVLFLVAFALAFYTLLKDEVSNMGLIRPVHAYLFLFENQRRIQTSDNGGGGGGGGGRVVGLSIRPCDKGGGLKFFFQPFGP